MTFHQSTELCSNPTLEHSPDPRGPPPALWPPHPTVHPAPGNH